MFSQHNVSSFLILIWPIMMKCVHAVPGLRFVKNAGNLWLSHAGYLMNHCEVCKDSFSKKDLFSSGRILHPIGNSVIYSVFLDPLFWDPLFHGDPYRTFLHTVFQNNRVIYLGMYANGDSPWNNANFHSHVQNPKIIWKSLKSSKLLIYRGFQFRAHPMGIQWSSWYSLLGMW